MTGAILKIRKRYRTDWFRVLVDLQYAGYPHARVADILGVPIGTLRGWKGGSEPAHHCGYELLEIWAEVTGKPVTARPMTYD